MNPKIRMLERERDNIAVLVQSIIDPYSEHQGSTTFDVATLKAPRLFCCFPQTECFESLDTCSVICMFVEPGIDAITRY